MKKLILLFFLFSSFLGHAAEWTLGDKKFDLIKINDQGHVSANCQKECELKTLAQKNLSKLNDLKITGGKDPASIYCKLLQGKVLYMAHEDLEETFCFYKKDIISLSLLLP